MINTDNIAWLGHSSFRLTGNVTAYFDPWEVDGPCADIIFITHEHSDHCCPETVKKISNSKTHIFTERLAAEKLHDAKINARITVLDPYDEIEVHRTYIKALPAYNGSEERHSFQKKYLGFYINFDGVNIYMAGDSGRIPEMSNLQPQVAMLPICGTGVMDAAEAAKASLEMKTKIVIPMHYGKIDKDKSMAYTLAELLKGKVHVLIKDIEK